MSVKTEDIRVTNIGADTPKITKGMCTNPYLLAFMQTFGLKEGDPFLGNKYASWIVSKHTEFKNANGLPRHKGYSLDENHAFISFINGRA